MITIIKADGTTQVFDGTKLEASLHRAGASSTTASHIREEVEHALEGKVTTHDIYRRAFRMLRTGERTVAARYSLRRALFDLGPTGHPFEDFIAELFRKEGWAVEWRKQIAGKCISHEVDLYAERDGVHLAGELKYHNDPNYKTDVKVALYVKARFDDIWQCRPDAAGVCPVDRGLLITNTKFTTTAVEYAKCAGIELLGASYPAEGNLFDRVIAAGIYPVTALTGLKRSEKRLLVDGGIVTSEQLKGRPETLRAMSVPEARITAILEEIEALARA